MVRSITATSFPPPIRFAVPWLPCISTRPWKRSPSRSRSTPTSDPRQSNYRYDEEITMRDPSRTYNTGNPRTVPSIGPPRNASHRSDTRSRAWHVPSARIRSQTRWVAVDWPNPRMRSRTTTRYGRTECHPFPISRHPSTPSPHRSIRAVAMSYPIPYPEMGRRPRLNYIPTPMSMPPWFAIPRLVQYIPPCSTVQPRILSIGPPWTIHPNTVDTSVHGRMSSPPPSSLYRWQSTRPSRLGLFGVALVSFGPEMKMTMMTTTMTTVLPKTGS